MNMSNKTKNEVIWTVSFFLLCMTNFILFLGSQMLMVTIPLYMVQNYADSWQVGVTLTTFMVSAILSRPLIGSLVERYGRMFFLLVGLLLYISTVMSFIVISEPYLILLMRIFQGISWGLFTTSITTLAVDAIPPVRRGEGIGYFSLTGNIAMVFGPALGLFLIRYIPFSHLFGLVVGLGICSLFSALVLKFLFQKQRTRFLQSELTVTPNITKTRFLNSIIEKTALVPSILLMFISFCLGGINVFLAIYASSRGIIHSEWFFIANALSMIVSRPIAGKIYDQKGPKIVILPSCILVFMAMLHLYLLNSLPVLILSAIFFGIGYGAVHSTLQVWSVSNASRNRRGLASATFLTFGDLGIALGSLTFGIFAPFLGYKNLFLIGAFSVLLSISLYLYIYFTNRIVYMNSYDGR